MSTIHYINERFLSQKDLAPHSRLSARSCSEEPFMSKPFGLGRVRDLSAEEVAAELASGRVLLVDVREARETSRERIPGSALLPLSRFDPAALPDP